MPEGYSGLPPYYIESSDPVTPFLGLSLVGMDPIIAEDFVLVDSAFGNLSLSIQVNGVVVPPVPNFVNSGTVTWTVIGSNIFATATGIPYEICNRNGKLQCCGWRFCVMQHNRWGTNRHSSLERGECLGNHLCQEGVFGYQHCDHSQLCI